MKKIAIVTRKMITGGVERALIAMLKQFDYSMVEVDLYLENLGGELYNEVPNEVNCYKIPTVSLKTSSKHPIATLKKMHALLKTKKDKFSYADENYYASRMLLPIKKKYDIAIAYHAPNTVPVFYVIDGINATKKILWLHGDLDTNNGQEKKLYAYHSRYDQVYGVSKSIEKNFIDYHPDMIKKVSVFYNYIDISEIHRKAELGETYDDNFDGIRVLSIGRLSKQKGFDIAIEVCAELVLNNCNFRWYICGEGDERVYLEKCIEDKGLKDHFILLGNKDNPYGYLKDCDLYVQTSRFEGYCTTTNEARMLYKPVITTDVSGAREQFEDGNTGWIVPINSNDIKEKMIYCFKNLSELEVISKNLSRMEFQGKEEIKRLLS